MKRVLIETAVLVLVSGIAAAVTRGGISAFLNTALIMGLLYMYIGIGTPADKRDISAGSYSPRDISFRHIGLPVGRFLSGHDVSPEKSLVLTGLAAVLISGAVMFLMSRM